MALILFVLYNISAAFACQYKYIVYFTNLIPYVPTPEIVLKIPQSMQYAINLPITSACPLFESIALGLTPFNEDIFSNGPVFYRKLPIDLKKLWCIY
jgi:hypothetical protein